MLVMVCCNTFLIKKTEGSRDDISPPSMKNLTPYSSFEQGEVLNPG
jgi:hypothetical protein